MLPKIQNNGFEVEKSKGTKQNHKEGNSNFK